VHFDRRYLAGLLLVPAATAAVPSSSPQGGHPATPPEILIIDVVGEF
jgi:hypothetical protein